MSSRRFCDICDNPLTTEDDKPFIRYFTEKPIQISLIPMRVDGGAANDLCVSCKLNIASLGSPTLPDYTKVEGIATLQSAALASGMGGKPISGGTQPVKDFPYEPSVKTPKEEPATQPKEEQG